MSERMAKYTTVVYPRNRNTDYGKETTVYATNAQEAINRAVEIGWAGRSEDALVMIRRVDDCEPRTLAQGSNDD